MENIDNNLNDLYADLFAYRFYLLDIYPENEREIIIKLKLKLFELGYNRNNINGIIYDFYNHYLIPINENDINNAMIYVYNSSSSLIYRTILNILNDMNDTDETNEETQELLTEEEFNELPVITNITNCECSICIEEIKEEEEVIRLNCNHYFHKNCIRSHLINYNSNCPLCRRNVNEE